MGGEAGIKRAMRLAEGADGRYAELMAALENQVTRWEWGTFMRHSLEPCFFEIHKFRRGQWLPAEPNPPLEGAHGYGFDVAGNMLIQRKQTCIEGDYYDTLYVREDGGIARYYFDDSEDKRWINVAWMSSENGHITQIDTVYRGRGHSTEVFSYHGGLPVSVERFTGDADSVDRHEFRDLEYTDDGEVLRIWRRLEDGHRALDYERPAADRTLPATRDQLRLALASAIEAALTTVEVDSPIFALALCYYDAAYQHLLPPHVAVGTTGERDMFVKVRGQNAPRFIWNPSEWLRKFEVELDSDVASLCESVNQDIWQNERFEETQNLFSEIAAELVGRKLALPTTEDFVCYVTNLSLGCGAEEAQQYATPEIRDSLERRGLL